MPWYVCISITGNAFPAPLHTLPASLTAPCPIGSHRFLSSSLTPAVTPLLRGALPLPCCFLASLTQTHKMPGRTYFAFIPVQLSSVGWSEFRGATLNQWSTALNQTIKMSPFVPIATWFWDSFHKAPQKAPAGWRSSCPLHYASLYWLCAFPFYPLGPALLF